MGHYHTQRAEGQDESCWSRIRSAIKLTESIGPSLEAIETISGQAVAARRRKHAKGDES
ncbi:MAG: hypothetical protein QOE67_850 [Solirubrobacteraceae bacterium]|jgi:hypothetical protein|nr:hypothetical protein [Solirubrobacteraceae bacterium]MEA2281151.1 hypothetical protein [Solirubrobacteraceae bacterium]